MLFSSLGDDDGEPSGGPGLGGTSVAEALKVPDRPRHLTKENAAFYEDLLLPPDYGQYERRDYIVSPGPFNPIPPLDHEIDMLFVMGSEGKEELDYDAMKALFHPLVHPNCDEVVNAVHHSFINLAILPDFLLHDDIALRYLDLKD
jgi:hypothetical protein